MKPEVSAMLDLLRDTQEIRRHVTDAAISQQLTPPTDAQWLKRCEDVTAARDRMADWLSVTG